MRPIITTAGWIAGGRTVGELKWLVKHSVAGRAVVKLLAQADAARSHLGL